MKYNLNQLLSLGALLVLMGLAACGGSDDGGTTPENKAPGTFSASVVDITFTSATVEWTQAIDPDGDAVTYSIILNGTTLESGITTTSVSLTGLDSEMSYSGTITASDGKGSTTSATFSFVTNGNQNPETFAVTVSNISKSTADLNWSTSTDPDGDAVTYSVKLGSSTEATSLTTTTYSLSGLTEGTAYTGTVEASDGNGGMSSASFSFTTTSNGSPSSFTVTVSDITSDAAVLTWTESTDPEQSTITYSVKLGGSEVATDLSVLTYTFSGLTAGTSYTGEVIANDGEGGATSSSFSFETSVNYVLDPDLFTSANFTVSATLVDCQLENGSNTKCYELTFISNPVPDDGPFCPATTSDVGGMGIYDGATNPGFQVMKATLFNAMESDGYDIIDPSGNIRISDFSTAENPSFAYCLQPVVDDGLTLKFIIPAQPELLSTPNTIESVELIGVSVDGVPMNGDPPSVTTGPMGNGNIPSLDPCGGHHDPSGYYHWHFIPESISEILTAYGLDSDISCTNITQDKTALSGFAKDGYPIYGSQDMDGSYPSDLDACNGHEAATSEYPDGIYHYHASSTEAPNMPPCVVGAAVANPFVVE